MWGKQKTWKHIIQSIYCLISCLWKKTVSLLRWHYINFIRIGLGEASFAKLEDVTVLYQSGNFVVIDKRQDIKINSNDPTDIVTVETQLRHLYPQHIDTSAGHGFRFVHRLDYATSGVLCVALNKKSSRWAHKAFHDRYVSKQYIALVRGHVSAAHEGIIEINVGIGEDSKYTDVHRMITENSPSCVSPRDAKTTLMLLEHGFYDGSPASKVLLFPHTGRTHQLRVHCMHIGHLIVGDYTYSNRQDVRPYRMMLHAYHLQIPMKYENISITADDVFVTSKDPKWMPSKVFRSISDIRDNTLISAI